MWSWALSYHYYSAGILPWRGYQYVMAVPAHQSYQAATICHIFKRDFPEHNHLIIRTTSCSGLYLCNIDTSPGKNTGFHSGFSPELTVCSSGKSCFLLYFCLSFCSLFCKSTGILFFLSFYPADRCLDLQSLVQTVNYRIGLMIVIFRESQRDGQTTSLSFRKNDSRSMQVGNFLNDR